jgi:putative peptidoglycan lipid II flippase
MVMITGMKAANATWERWSKRSVNRKILGAAVLIGALTIAVKAISAAKEMMVAGAFGVGPGLDSFVIALSFPMLLNTIVSGSLQYAFIPVYLRVRESEGEERAEALLGNALYWIAAVLCAVATLASLAAPLYVPLLTSGFDPAYQALTIRFARFLAPMLILTGITGVLGAVLNSRERFALASLIPMATPALTIALIALWKANGLGILVAGSLAGAALECAALIAAVMRSGIRLRPLPGRPDRNMRKVLGSYLPLVAGALLMNGTTLVDNAMAAMLDGGSVSAMAYASKLIAFPITLAVTSLGTAVFPYFARMAAARDWPGIRHSLRKWMRIIFAATIPATLAMCLGARLIVGAFYEHGAFTPQDTAIVAKVFSMFALQAPFYVASIIVVRLLSAIEANTVLMWGSAVNLTANIALNYAFMKPMGVAGIALSTSFVYLISFAFLYAGLRGRMAAKGIDAHSRERGASAGT